MYGLRQMPSPKPYRITARFPPDEAKRVAGILKVYNKGKRAKDRVSLNDWLVVTSRAADGVQIQNGKLTVMPVGWKPGAHYVPIPIGEYSVTVEAGKAIVIPPKRTPADVAADIPGLTVGMPAKEESDADEGWW